MGAVVSRKIQRSTPSSEVPGLVASADISPLELLMLVPDGLQVTAVRVRELAPELVAAVEELRHKLWIELPEVLIFIAQQLYKLEQQGFVHGTEVNPPCLNHTLGMQLHEGFNNMPYRQNLEELRAAL